MDLLFVFPISCCARFFWRSSTGITRYPQIYGTVRESQRCRCPTSLQIHKHGAASYVLCHRSMMLMSRNDDDGDHDTEFDDAAYSAAEETMEEYVISGSDVGIVGKSPFREMVLKAVERKLNAGMLADVRFVFSSGEFQALAGYYDVELVKTTPIRLLEPCIVCASQVDSALNFSLSLDESFVKDAMLIHNSQKVVLIVEEAKKLPAVSGIGSFSIEISPCNHELVLAQIKKVIHKYMPEDSMFITLRYDKDNCRFKTSEGNLLVDVTCRQGRFFAPTEIHNLVKDIDAICGVLVSSLFGGIKTHAVVVACDDVAYIQPARRLMFDNPEIVNMKLNVDDEEELREKLENVPAWEFVCFQEKTAEHGAITDTKLTSKPKPHEHELFREFRFDSWPAVREFVDRVYILAEQLEANPQISVLADTGAGKKVVQVRLFTEKYRGVTDKDILMAQEIASFA